MSALRDFDTAGRLFRASADAVVMKDARLDIYLELCLSKALLEAMPRDTKQFLFKDTGKEGRLSLRVYGSAKKPSVSFSTDLLKVKVSNMPAD